MLRKYRRQIDPAGERLRDLRAWRNERRLGHIVATVSLAALLWAAMTYDELIFPAIVAGWLVLVFWIMPRDRFYSPPRRGSSLTQSFVRGAIAGAITGLFGGRGRYRRRW